ncbi:MAG: hypothetical protein V1749_04440 [Candidatus Desantisbacteria bacterium]
MNYADIIEKENPFPCIVMEKSEYSPNKCYFRNDEQKVDFQYLIGSIPGYSVRKVPDKAGMGVFFEDMLIARCFSHPLAHSICYPDLNHARIPHFIEQLPIVSLRCLFNYIDSKQLQRRYEICLIYY